MKPHPLPGAWTRRRLAEMRAAEPEWKKFMEELHAHLRAQPRPGLAKPVSDEQHDADLERAEGWSLEPKEA